MKDEELATLYAEFADEDRRASPTMESKITKEVWPGKIVGVTQSLKNQL